VATGSSEVRVEERGVHVGHGPEHGGDEEDETARGLRHEEHGERGEDLHVELRRGHEERGGEAEEAGGRESLDGAGVEHEALVGVHGEEDGVEEVHEHEVHGDCGVGALLGAAEDGARDGARGGREQQHLHEKLGGDCAVAHAEDHGGQGCGEQQQHGEQERRAQGVDAERVVLALEERHQHRRDLAQPGHALQKVHCARAAPAL